ncbi:alpha/beta hydrolase [Streptomyces sp. NPDC059740]|uniref:alpha/beta hydrolase n=1 Tax=Streptomyces sp. NPDC059740 TaxID=3346926 RepID=UPI0036481E0A
MASQVEGPGTASCVSSLTSGVHRALLLTEDGVRIEAAFTPRTPPPTSASAPAADRPAPAVPAPAPPLIFVLAHGFTGSLERPALLRAAAVLARHAPVVTFSFRGHGRSGGRSTVGDREVWDLAAAVRWARCLARTRDHSPGTAPRVVTVGFSMGGSVVLRHAALYQPEATDPEHAGAHADAVVAVSAPARWYYRGTAPMRRVHWAVTRPAGRLVSRWGLRTRIHTEDWDPVPLSPVESVPLIAPRPLLVVHGDRDPYFPLDHPRSLLAAAEPGRAELWLEAGFGHAENAADPALLERIADWAGG